MLNLRKINNEMKGLINQADFISRKTRNKLINLVATEFDVDLPIDNYVNVDIQFTEDKNIIMRGDEYKLKTSLTVQEFEEKYYIFKEKAELLLNKKEVNFYNKKDINNSLNIIIVLVLSVLYLIVIIAFIKAIIRLQLFTASILGALLSSYLAPNIRDRFQQAKNFLKRKIKRKK